MPVNFLTYHYLRNLERKSFFKPFTRERQDFISQVEFISKIGSGIINPKDKDKVDYYLASKEEHAFILTFDDAYKDHFWGACTLNNYGYFGLFFLPKLPYMGITMDVNLIHLLFYNNKVDPKDVKIFVENFLINKKVIIKAGNKFQRFLSFKKYINSLQKDGGFDNQLENALKRLLQRDIKSLKIRQELISNLLNEFVPIKEITEFKDNLYLNSKEIKSIVSNGHSIAGHGSNHYWLSSMDYITQLNEIKDSLKLFSYLVYFFF